MPQRSTAQHTGLMLCVLKCAEVRRASCCCGLVVCMNRPPDTWALKSLAVRLLTPGCVFVRRHELILTTTGGLCNQQGFHVGSSPVLAAWLWIHIQQQWCA